MLAVCPTCTAFPLRDAIELAAFRRTCTASAPAPCASSRSETSWRAAARRCDRGIALAEWVADHQAMQLASILMNLTTPPDLATLDSRHMDESGVQRVKCSICSGPGRSSGRAHCQASGEYSKSCRVLRSAPATDRAPKPSQSRSRLPRKHQFNYWSIRPPRPGRDASQTSAFW